MSSVFQCIIRVLKGIAITLIIAKLFIWIVQTCISGAGPMRVSIKYLDSSFDSNVIQYCPVGEFTPYSHVRDVRWKLYALKVTRVFGDNTWLGSSDVPGSWLISYHGTSYDNARSIVKQGFRLSKGRRFAYGRGIYTTPNISVAESYASIFVHAGEKYGVIIQCRVNPANVNKYGYGSFWVSPGDKDVRPYALCVKKV